MSGIAGLVRFGGAACAPELDVMLRLMQARGPDRQATAYAGEAGFAHALLATTPEAHAEPQPWRDHDTGCLVVADSRLDNRAEVLHALGIARRADEVGDCELLHAAWQRWGTDCADRLRGDFAFVLWHPGTRELFIARDPMGVRPLAFHFAAGRLFVFGSTTDIVLAQGQVPTELDQGRIADALIGETEGIDQVCTLYKAVERLPPAHWMRVRGDRIEQCRYWRPIGESPPPGLPRTEADWVDAQREQLDRAVRLRLRSHRPVGAMLSGGLDSSSVVALAALARAEDSQSPLSVFAAIDSSNPDCTETRHARAVASHVRCSPRWLDLPAFEHTCGMQPAWWDTGVEPFDGGMTMIAALYRAASSQGVASLLDGTPADNLYSTGRQARALLRNGHWARALQAALAESRTAQHPHFNAMKTLAGCVAPNAVHALCQWCIDLRDYRVLRERSMISPSLIARAELWKRYRRCSSGVGDGFQWHPSGDACSSMAAPFITVAIERYNRVASLFGVEPRHPFADRDLIEFQAWMPIPLRNRDGHRKYVLREAMASDLPDAVRWRRDKSHLGWKFSRAQMGCILVNGLDADLLARWVQVTRPADNTRGEADPSPNQLYPAFALQRWLLSQTAQRPVVGADGIQSA